MNVISVEHVSKSFKQYASPWKRLLEWISPVNKATHYKLKNVLRDISFKVKSGEALGIVGINGAGKSTLLKMIAGTSQPSSGTIKLTGKVAALLELGMGFHPDFTGRQNAIMAGQLLGHTSNKMLELMPEIEAFAEIGDYMDQPLRVYSSGMQMRLAFSVATAQRPDVLIVDEALSVGDAYFQHKSFERIRQFRKQGTTFLIVTHDKGIIQTMCDRAILLNAGQLAMEGEPEAVMDYYNAMLAKREEKTVIQAQDGAGKIKTRSGNARAIIQSVQLINQSSQSIDTINTGEKATLKIHVIVNEDLNELVLGYAIKDRLGQTIFGTNTHHLKQALLQVKANTEHTYLLHFDALLGEGTYSVTTALHSADSHIGENFDWQDLALVFNVINTLQPQFVGTSWMPPKIEHIQHDE
jgi:lipopolysaccharide transport system ATP-binding protein